MIGAARLFTRCVVVSNWYNPSATVARLTTRVLVSRFPDIFYSPLWINTRNALFRVDTLRTRNTATDHNSITHSSSLCVTV